MTRGNIEKGSQLLREFVGVRVLFIPGAKVDAHHPRQIAFEERDALGARASYLAEAEWCIPVLHDLWCHEDVDVAEFTA